MVTKDSVLEGLNPEQAKVASHLYGPALVIAGAGSGKTSSLTRRVARLILEGTRPDAILLLTFTNKAANEMMSRAAKLLDMPKLDVQGGTFHSYAFKKLMTWGNRLHEELYPDQPYTPRQVLDAGDSEKLLNSCLQGQFITEGLTKEEKGDYRVGELGALVSLAKNTLVDLSTLLEEQPFSDKKRKLYLRVADRYEDAKKEYRYYDFDDLLLEYLKLLRSDALREAACGFARHIMLDEYQDSNPLQFALVQEMYKVTTNIMAVGDDAQSIYKFRGADFQNILNFPTQFPDVKLYYLQTNYRSGQTILNVGNAIVNSMREKFDKTLTAHKSHTGEVLLWKPRTSYEQADNVVNVVKNARYSGIPLSEIAILSRSAVQTMEVESTFVREGIPFVKWGGLRFFDKAHVKDLVAILRIKMSLTDKQAGMRVLSLFPKVGEKTAEKYLESAKEGTLGVVLGKKKNYEYGEALIDILEPMDLGMDDAEIFDAAVESYKPLCQLNYKEDYKERLEELSGLKDTLAEAQSLQEFIALIALASAGENEQGDAVVISTIHAFKGLERHTVIVLNVVEGSLPFVKAVSAADVEEEKRLFHVATTRAKEVLILSCPKSIQLFGETQLAKMSSFMTADILSHCDEKLLPEC